MGCDRQLLAEKLPAAAQYTPEADSDADYKLQRLDKHAVP